MFLIAAQVRASNKRTGGIIHRRRDYLEEGDGKGGGGGVEKWVMSMVFALCANARNRMTDSTSYPPICDLKKGITFLYSKM